MKKQSGRARRQPVWQPGAGARKPRGAGFVWPEGWLEKAKALRLSGTGSLLPQQVRLFLWPSFHLRL